jgi:protein-tyrosine phosphatase
MDELELHKILSDDKRHLQWPGSFNIRDIGGYPTRDGRRTRWRTLLRGAGYFPADAGVSAEALELGVRTVVDLRSAPEYIDHPSPFRSAATLYINEPLFLGGDELETSRSQQELYRTVIDRRALEIARILSSLAQPEFLPALVHCSLGKDRTGIVIAVLLSLLGVGHELVAEDYGLSTRFLPASLAQAERKRAPSLGLSRAEWSRRFPSSPGLMTWLLEYIDSAYGGVRAYLHSGGLVTGHIETLRGLLTE